MVSSTTAPALDLSPPKPWMRFIPLWLRSLIWVDSARTYDAFLSYSWKSDAKVAPVIQSLLQRFLCPWYRLRTKTVFRDLSCLPAGSSLEEELFDRLDRSRHLIVLASPEAVVSHGMEMEARHWFSSPRQGQALIIVTAGSGTTWEEIRDRLLPPAVRNGLTSEPLWIPLQHRRELILTSPNEHHLRGELIEDLKQVLLRLHPDRDWGQLRGEERSQRRRAITLLSAFTLLVLGLAVTTIGIAWYAQQQRMVAQSRLHANQSLNYVNRQPDLALLLAMHAVQLSNTVDARSSLLHALVTQPSLVTYLRGHDTEVASVTIDSTGTIAVSGDSRGKILFWELPSGRRLDWQIDQKEWIRSLAVSPNGKTLASGSDDHTVRLWDIRSRLPLAEPLQGHRGIVNTVAFSPNGTLLASGSSDGNVILWGLPNGRQLEPPIDPKLGSIFELSFSPDGQRLAVGGHLGARVLDLQSHEWIWSAEGKKTVINIVYAPDDNATIAIAYLDGKIALQHVENESLTAGMPVARVEELRAIAFSADGAHLFSGDGNGFIRRWNRKTMKEDSPVWRASEGGTTGVSRIAVSHDGHMVVSAQWDGTLVLWDLDRRCVLSVDLPSIQKEAADSVAFSPDGRLLLLGGRDKTLSLWDLFDRSRTRELSATCGTSFQSICVSPDGSKFAAKDAKRQLVVGSLDDQVPVVCLPVKRPVISYVLFISKDELVYGAQDGVVLWRLETQTEKVFRPLPSHAPVLNVAVNIQRQMVAAADRNGTIAIFDAGTLELIESWQTSPSIATTSLDFSPDGAFLARSDESGAITLWRVSNHEVAWMAEAAQSWGVAICPNTDNAILASGGTDGTITLWDLASGQRIGPSLPTHPGGVVATTFSPDGKLLASVGVDGRISFLETTMTAWKTRACQVAARDLTPEEAHRFLEDMRYRPSCSSSPTLAR